MPTAALYHPRGFPRGPSGQAWPVRDDRPLLPYTALTGVFHGALGTALWVAHRRGKARALPARDIALLAVATQKLSRIVATDRVTSFVRAPFTRVEETGGG